MLGRKYCYSKGYGTVNVLYHFSRYSSCYGTCRNVLVYHRTCRYDSVVSNGHARQDGWHVRLSIHLFRYGWANDKGSDGRRGQSRDLA